MLVKAFLCCLLHLGQSLEETCPLSSDGSCQQAKPGQVVPSCEEDIELKDLVERAKLLCNPRHVPESVRPPKKISGLYWLKGLPLPDIAGCFSTGEWDQATLTLKLIVWRDFFFKNDFAGRSLAGALYESSFAYLIKFKDDTLSEADITPTTSSRLFSPLVTAFASISSFPLIEVTGVPPGNRYARPSYFGIADFKVLTNEYEAWKILDADLHPVMDNVQMMMKLLPRQIGDKHLVKFSEGPCAADTKTDARRSDRSCSSGVFLELAKQPRLGLLHQEIEGGELKLLHAFASGCHAEYSLICREGVFEVKESHLCSSGHFTGPGAAVVEQSWELCSSKDFSLSLLTPVLDLVWDVEIPIHTAVEGCLRVSLPEDSPELEKIRGSMEEQKKALIQRKKEVGGCPTFRTASDRLERAKDFEGSGLTGAFSRQYLKLLQKELSERAKVWSHAPPGANLETLMDSAIHVASLATFLPYFANRTTAFRMCAALNCGEPVPFVDGPMRFHYKEVASVQADPKQKRVWSLITTAPAEECHARTLPLFFSSGTPEHTQWRMLLDAAGFADMHTKELTSASSLLDAAWLEKVRRAIGLKSMLPPPTEMEVARIVIPLVFEGIWGKKMQSSDVYKILPYVEFGKMCILGKRGKSIGVVQPIAVGASKSAAIAFARDSPTAEMLAKLIQEPRFSVLKTLLETTEQTGESLQDKLLRNIIDASLFAGVLGTTDMTTKCVQSQFKDGNHVMMFRKNAGSYLHELMRLDAAVQQFTTALDKEETMVLEGHKVAFSKGQPVNMVMATANRDRSVFPDPDVFDPDRENLDMMLTWNGQLNSSTGHVMSRNYSGAPRFCPGYHLSMKVAKEVCAQFTKDLNQWGGFQRDHKKIEGLVKIKARGYFGKHAAVAYFDFSKDKYCLTEKHHHDEYIGCFDDEELEVIDPNGGRPKTLEEEYNMCPKLVPAMMQTMLRVLAKQVETHSTIGWMLERLLGKRPESESFHPDWADDFVIGLYAGINLISMPMYASRHANSVFVPRRKGTVEVFSVGNVVAPDVDIDNPKFVPVEWYIPQPLLEMGMVPAMTCFHGFLRQLPWDDMLETDRNTWDLVMNLIKVAYERKADWVMSFYKGYKTIDGIENWPEMEVDFARMYWKRDEWDDALEKAIAFGLIASHRLEQLDPAVEFGGESLPFVIRLNQFHALQVRKNFGKFQGDLYFTKDGYPAMMELADGTKVARGDKDWQYWKFAWRCSLITVITLTDHLHMTHFRAANVMATAVRKTLSPNHPLRRLLSVFTFGSIFVNLQAMHTLIGPRHVLHRSTPFVQFEDLSEVVPQNLLPLTEKHKALLKDEEWAKLPSKVQESPYFSDGKLLFDAERKLLKDFRELYGYGSMGMCSSSDDKITGPEAAGFLNELVAENAHSHYASSLHPNVTCTEFFEEILMSYIWTVTGWHRHVGTVGDYYRDPELASFSWRDGERVARPLQHMQMTTVAVFTSSLQPKIIEDYSHVFQGVYKEPQMIQIMDRFRAQLGRVSKEIEKRNEKRLHDPDMGFKNIHADPKIVECSVAV